MKCISALCAFYALHYTVLLDIHANAERCVICLLTTLLTMQCGRHHRKICKMQLLSNIVLSCIAKTNVWRKVIYLSAYQL